MCAGPLALVNGGFEDPASIDEFGIIVQEQVPGWDTTESDGRIEIWQSGFRSVPAAAGEQFSELAANEPSELYQDLTTVPGTLLGYSVSHRGRDGVDTMQIQIGPPGAAPNFTRDVTTGNTAWQQVLGTYEVPAGQSQTRFGFAALSSASSLISAGNFLDGVTFGAARCSVTLSKELVPAADPGRFDLVLGDEVIVPAVGDGGGTGEPAPVVLGAVRVSERAAAGADLDEYASAVRCRDAASGNRPCPVRRPGAAAELRPGARRSVHDRQCAGAGGHGAEGALSAGGVRPVRPAHRGAVSRPPPRATAPSPVRSRCRRATVSWCPSARRRARAPPTTSRRCSAVRGLGTGRWWRRRADSA